MDQDGGRHRRRSGAAVLARTGVVLSAALVSMAALGGIASAAESPPGSNGSVKIDGAPVDGSLGNEPHVSCSFDVDFYGFDAGTDTGTVSFTAQDPSGTGPVALASGASTFTFDGNGTGNTLDTEQPYQLDTAGLTLQPQQGYHIRVDTTVTNAAGELTWSKSKVFWLDCAPPAPQLVAPTLSGVCDTTTGAVDWTVTNPNDVDLTGSWSVRPGDESGSVTAAANGTGEFTSTTGGTATVDFPDEHLVAGPVRVDCALVAPALVAPTLAGVCNTATGSVTWTVTNPNDADLSGAWSVLPGDESGSVSAPANGTGQFTSTTGGTATVQFDDADLVAGPVTVDCVAPVTTTLVAPSLAGACDTSTGAVTWTLTNPNDVDLTGTWEASGLTGSVTAPANGTGTFTTAAGAVQVSFPASTQLSAVTSTLACVEAVHHHRTVHHRKPHHGTPGKVSTPPAGPSTQVLGERAVLTPQALPFTGAAHISALVGGAAGSLAVGCLLLVAGGRRRRTT